jgi:hypothetical protein
MKPVRLVAAVAARKIAVQPLNRSPVSSPNTTANPAPIPTRLNKTWTRVNVDVVIPAIIEVSFYREDVTDVRHDTFIPLAGESSAVVFG